MVNKVKYNLECNSCLVMPSVNNYCMNVFLKRIIRRKIKEDFYFNYGLSWLIQIKRFNCFLKIFK